MTNWPKISILCVNYNGQDQITDFLKSTQKLHYPKDKLQTIVVDNHSTDNSISLIEKNFKDVQVVKLAKNSGYAPAINIGLAKTQGQYTLIANNDLVLSPKSLSILVDFCQKNPDVAIVGGKILSKADSSKIISLCQTFNYTTGRVQMVTKNIKKPQNVQWVQGAAMLIPKSTFVKIGTFDPGFEKIYFEDLDLCRRAQLQNLKTVIVPSAIFYHYQSYTMDNLVTKNFKWYNWHKNKIRFALKHASPFQVVTILIFEAAASILQTFFKNQPHIGPFIKALVTNFKNFNEIKEKRTKLY